jgi:hypothetical protein
MSGSATRPEMTNVENTTALIPRQEIHATMIRLRSNMREERPS